ncbi:hypothetical protein GPECTOR_96g708 [Gonium pectorale]|uniref:FATC domain-containing protein n=1 Tax=Gonium pectorale TaxID=33097 RepID=A0A150G065_GONPE|nr:hypothetical protein GPECTOR_96g708 [Gonium pectorale]|eukprot:KXZ43242.1 hypothetical protein GPECTOR_96g708 [Gonium pectorale]
MRSSVLRSLANCNNRAVLERLNKACPQVPLDPSAAAAAAAAGGDPGGRPTPPSVGGPPPPSPYVLLPGAAELIAAAQDPKNLCRMEPTWHPWF